MVLLVLLIIAIVLQIFAAGIAVRLTRTTKFNSSWILFTIALVLMCAMRFNEFAQALAVKIGGNVAEYIIMPEGVYVWVGVFTSLCFAVGVFMIQKVLNYITLREEQRRHSEKRILSAVIQAEENQRQIMSKELHDGLGPLLSSVKMSVSALATQPLDERQQEILANADYVINEAVKGLKEISNNLSPHILNNFGVERALNTFVNKLQPMCKTRITVTTNMRDIRFNEDKEIILYRVLCELINNSLKHAAADNLWVDMQWEKGNITVVARDDGKGFDPEETYDGMGLSNMASRISSIKGEFRIESTPVRKGKKGPGTRVFIRINAK